MLMLRNFFGVVTAGGAGAGVSVGAGCLKGGVGVAGVVCDRVTGAVAGAGGVAGMGGLPITRQLTKLPRATMQVATIFHLQGW